MNEQRTRKILEEMAKDGQEFNTSNPELAKILLGLGATASYAPIVGGGIDLLTGDTNGTNSGELPLNVMLALGAPTIGSLAGLGLGSINRGDEALEDIRRSGGNAQGLKDKLKKIAREEGPDAAKQYFADAKNSRINKEVSELRASRGGRRIAGSVLGGLVGSGIAMRSMVDDSYGDGQVYAG